MQKNKPHSIIETELRARIDNVQEFRDRLKRARAHLVSMHIMRDFLFDTAEKTLTNRKQKLRLRIYDNSRTVMSWKEKKHGASQYKEEYEHEVEIGDFETMRRIFEGLGYGLVRRVDRRVEIYHWRHVIIRIEFFPAMDVLAEIEGPKAELEQVIRELGLTRSMFFGKGQEFFFEAYQKRTGQKPRTFYEKEGFSRSVGAVVLNERNHVLIVFQKKSQYWEFPKGKVDRGESDLETLRREIREETGITKYKLLPGFAQPMYFDFVLNSRTLVHREVTFYLLKTSQLPVISKEHTAMKWVKLAVVKRYLVHPNQRKLIDYLKYYLAK
ncbi:MAG: NUDIX domain-containing protein [Candidatus Kerfeldbacteria bacterium]|nr:NUDIX domain-containing protein [Candidatus Kerfeldbacteria bacterium]